MFKQKPRLFLIFVVLIVASTSAHAAPQIFTIGNVLAAGNYNDGLSSSDITLIIQLEAGGNIIFDEGAKVKYLVPEADVAGWNEREFDDSNWEDGITGVGYGDGDDNTEIPMSQEI